jgi:hypothetical protein
LATLLATLKLVVNYQGLVTMIKVARDGNLAIPVGIHGSAS